MATFEYRTRLDHPRQVVFEWFERPGALVRLTPPFSGTVRREPSDGIRPGSTAELGIGAPGSLGLLGSALDGMGLPFLRPQLGWLARHTHLDPGRSFVDVMESGPLRSWRHEHLFEDVPDGGTLMTDRIDFELPAPVSNAWTLGRIRAELERMFAFRARQVSGDLDFHGGTDVEPRTIAVTGSTGLIGRQVVALLTGGGHQVLRLIRRPARSDDEISWDPDRGVVDVDRLAGCDVVIHLGGHPIGGRFTAENKQKMMSSRTASTATLARALAELAVADGRQRAFVVASAIGIYGAQAHADERARGAEPTPLAEDAAHGDDFLAQVCVAWEDACQVAREAGVRVVNVRTGLVLSPDAGYLSRFLPLFLAGVGGPLGKDAWQSWIGIDDMAAVHARAALDDAVVGPLNAVAPEPVTAAEFARTLGEVLRRPFRIPVPRFGPTLLLGSQGAREMADADQRVTPAVLERLGFEFRHPRLADQLRHVLGR